MSVTTMLRILQSMRIFEPVDIRWHTTVLTDVKMGWGKERGTSEMEVFFFQAEDGIRDRSVSRGLGVLIMRFSHGTIIAITTVTARVTRPILLKTLV